jgi:hypothetical protein
VEEVFYLLQSTPIRSKKSFDSLRSDVSGISKKNVDNLLGKNLMLTFTGSISYNILGNNVTLYTANCLFNAKVARFEDHEGSIILNPMEDKSMYIAYTAYQVNEEAEKELQKIEEKLNEYYNALTIDQLIKKRYEEEK